MTTEQLLELIKAFKEEIALLQAEIIKMKQQQYQLHLQQNFNLPSPSSKKL